MKMIAVKNKILVQIIEEEEKKGVVIVPQERKEVLKAIVLSTGEHVTNIPLNQLVLIGAHSGHRIPDDILKNLRIIKEDDILLVFE